MPTENVKTFGDIYRMVHTCEVCGEPANYGFGCDTRKALATRDPRHAGRWYCDAHVPSDQSEKAAA
jgi:hypothetical protein